MQRSPCRRSPVPAGTTFGEQMAFPSIAFQIAMFTLACIGGAGAATPLPPVSSAVIVATSKLEGPVNGSKYRHAGAFNAALRAALATCGKGIGPGSSGVLGAETASSIRKLRTCLGWDLEGERGSGDITEALWRKLLPKVPVPDAFARLFMVTMTLEGTDYDRFEWNYDASDPTAWATWGPFGATVGQGGEVQLILAAVERDNRPSPVKSAFEAAAAAPDDPGDLPLPGRKASRYAACRQPAPGPAADYDLFRKVVALRGTAAGDVLRTAFCDDHRFAVWIKAFRILGGEAVARRAYDDLYLRGSAKVAAYIAGARGAYADAGVVATEIDLAMGVDGSTQFSPRADRSRVAAAIRSAGPSADPVLRRASISERIAPGRNGKDRCGRDGVFLVAHLETIPKPVACAARGWDLHSAWLGRAGFTAEEVGLKDVAAPGLVPAWAYDFDHQSVGHR